MRDTRRLRKLVIIGVAAAVGAAIAESLKPNLARKLRVRP